MSNIVWIDPFPLNEDDDTREIFPLVHIPPMYAIDWLSNPLVTMQHPTDEQMTWDNVRIGGPLYRSMIELGWREVGS